jgi:hypothetical protein
VRARTRRRDGSRRTITRTRLGFRDPKYNCPWASTSAADGSRLSVLNDHVRVSVTSIRQLTPSVWAGTLQRCIARINVGQLPPADLSMQSEAVHAFPRLARRFAFLTSASSRVIRSTAGAGAERAFRSLAVCSRTVAAFAF